MTSALGPHVRRVVDRDYGLRVGAHLQRIVLGSRTIYVYIRSMSSPQHRSILVHLSVLNIELNSANNSYLHGVVQHLGGRVHDQVLQRRDLRSLPAAQALVVVDLQHVVGEEAAEA